MIVGDNQRFVSTLATAGVLFTFASGSLSDFERETLATVCARFIEHGRETVITEPEWHVVQAAACAMAQRAAPEWMAARGFAVEYRFGRRVGPAPLARVLAP